MLVVTTTVRVIDGVHSHTTSAGPRVPLDLELVVSTTGLEQGLVDTSTASNDADGGTRGRGDGLLGTRGQTDARGLAVGVVANDGGVVARSTGERATVTRLLLDVADDGTFGERREGEDVGNVERGLLTAVDELTGGETLGSDKGLDTGAVLVRVTESDLGKGSTTVSIEERVDEKVKIVSIRMMEGRCIVWHREQHRSDRKPLRRKAVGSIDTAATESFGTSVGVKQCREWLRAEQRIVSSVYVACEMQSVMRVTLVIAGMLTETLTPQMSNAKHRPSLASDRPSRADAGCVFATDL